MGKEGLKKFENVSLWCSFVLILVLVAYCIYSKTHFGYIIILSILFIFLPHLHNITDFSLASLLRIKIEREVERLMPDLIKAYKKVFQREFVSEIKNDSIELEFLPDPETIKLSYGHETDIPFRDRESFEILGKNIRIKDQAKLRAIEFFIKQSLPNRPIVEYLRNIDNEQSS